MRFYKISKIPEKCPECKKRTEILNSGEIQCSKCNWYITTPILLFYSNLKLLCDTHELSYRSVDDKLKRQGKPYEKGNMIVTEHHMIMG